ncbi:glycosyltransferase [Salinisphaera sp. SPP-AMP-43]|uniref:glycosyltransferase n=1 Tax=Salinisphaera sp. SPP-AMP-43 TaxID=3121288 RepID=UPI003C6DDC95
MVATAQRMNYKTQSSLVGYRQVLMIAFHYPPIAASAGALRSRAFASYLPDYGWQAHILAPKLEVYDELDYETPMPCHGEVHRSWALDARRHLGWKGRYPAWVAVPDRWAAWAPSAIALGRRLIREHAIDAIWSTYPIATSHLIGAVLARWSGLPWIAEFRDPVRPDGKPLQCWAHRAIERRIAIEANRAVFVTAGARQDYVQRFPFAAGRSEVIPNGFDEAFTPVAAAEPRQSREVRPITVLHTGHLYETGRNPGALFAALAQLKQEKKIDARQLQIVFRNSQQDELFQAEIDRLDIADLVTLSPRIAHERALVEQAEADGLLLLQGREFNTQVPAKLFEYLRVGRPVLALVDPEGDTAGLLDELDAGVRADACDVKEIAAAVMMFVEGLRLQPGGDPAWIVDDQRLQSYSRRHQTGRLATMLEEVTARKSTD